MKTRIILVTLLLVGFFANAQQPPFWNDVQAFKKQDSIKKPEQKRILFIGSSSFTNWKDVQEYFPYKPIINRAFGGSTLADLIRYKEDIIRPYNPRQIVMYCGENDFAASDTVTVATVFTRFKIMFDWINTNYRHVQFAYVSMKPSPSRVHLMPKYVEANKLIQQYLKKFRSAAFINVYNAMLKPDGKPMPDIFLNDDLHMNSKGYEIWQKIMKPYLK